MDCISVIGVRISARVYRFQVVSYRAGIRQRDGKLIWRRGAVMSDTFSNERKAKDAGREIAARQGLPFLRNVRHNREIIHLDAFRAAALAAVLRTEVEHEVHSDLFEGEQQSPEHREPDPGPDPLG